MKIIFVGEHNKRGLKPLCSTSKSGELIDIIISHFQEYETILTNLYDTDETPHITTKHDHALLWHNRITASMDDVIVLLGKEVQKNFFPIPYMRKIIHIHHPGYILRPWSKVNVDEYVNSAVAKIKKYCN